MLQTHKPWQQKTYFRPEVFLTHISTISAASQVPVVKQKAKETAKMYVARPCDKIIHVLNGTEQN